MAKKPKPMNRVLGKLSMARALVYTVELALATIGEESTFNDAQDVRLVALMATKRLRKIEAQLSAHYDAEVRHD